MFSRLVFFVIVMLAISNTASALCGDPCDAGDCHQFAIPAQTCSASQYLGATCPVGQTINLKSLVVRDVADSGDIFSMYLYDHKSLVSDPSVGNFYSAEYNKVCYSYESSVGSALDTNEGYVYFECANTFQTCNIEGKTTYTCSGAFSLSFSGLTLAILALSFFLNSQ